MRNLIISLFFLLAIVQATLAKEIIQDPNLKKGVLKNGLTYYVYKNDSPKGEAVYRLFLKSGSVLEEENQKGLAHFIEHMAFNGTKNFPNSSLVKYLESKGAKFGKDLNAHTSMNETVYKLQLPTKDKKFVDSTLTILSDWAGGLQFDSLEIESERRVILSEWYSRSGDKNNIETEFLIELLNNSRYSKRLTIGDTSVIKNFPQSRLKQYYKNWYNPSLMAVAVVGDIDPVEIERQIIKKFDYLNKSKTAKYRTFDIENYLKDNVKIIKSGSVTKTDMSIIQLVSKSRGVKTEDDYKNYLHRLVFNRLIKARFNDLSFSNKPYANASAGISNFMNIKDIIQASFELNSTNIDSSIVVFANDLEKIYRYGFINYEIEKVKKSYLNDFVRKVESGFKKESSSIMDEIYSEFYSGNKIVSLSDELTLLQKYISKIDSTSLINYIKGIKREGKTHYIITTHRELASKIPAEARILEIFNNSKTRSIEKYSKIVENHKNLLDKDPVAGKIITQTEIKEINGIILELSNGAKVLFKRSDRDKDKILLSGFRKGGLYSLDSTNYINGLFAGSIISLSGAGKFSRDELSSFLAGNTASMRFLIDKTRSGVIGGSGLKDAETMFQLMYLKWTSPKVENSVYEVSKQKYIENYLNTKKTDTEKYFEELKYITEKMDYANKEISDIDVKQKLAKDSLISVFNNSFGVGTGYTFVLLADCDLAEVKDLIVKYIGGLPKGMFTKGYTYKGPVVVKKDVEFVKNIADSPKSTVNLIFQQTDIPDDFRQYNLSCDILKSVLRSRLLSTLREKMGMVYSVSVSASATQTPSSLSRETISFNCKPQDVDNLIIETMTQIRIMISNPSVFEKELTDVKLSMIKDMSLELQKNAFWSGYIRNVFYNNEQDWSYTSCYDSLVNNINAKDIAQLMQKLFIDSAMIKSVLNPRIN